MKHSLFFKCNILLWMSSLLLPATFSSCNNDDLLNNEADITRCILTKDSSILLYPSDTTVRVYYSSKWDTIRILVKKGIEVGMRAPEFVITPGATIHPESGSMHDFSNPSGVEYTVTSQDRQWSRKYVVLYTDSVFFPRINPVFSFDFSRLNQDGNSAKNNRYYEIGERDEANNAYYWASGNAGFMRARPSARPMEYPTIPYEEGRTGKCVQLTTTSTGSLGATIKMPKAAGNIFLGTFDADIALAGRHKEATRFGTPFNRIPLTLSGWYKYKAGNVITDQDNKEVEGQDVFDIYAVLYENTDPYGNPYMLDGTNVRSLPNPRIIALTYFPPSERGETDEWTYFSWPFEYVGKIDEDRLHRNGYNIAIVCTSSIDGANFTGAIGSTLWVDDFSITCK